MAVFSYFGPKGEVLDIRAWLSIAPDFLRDSIGTYRGMVFRLPARSATVNLPLPYDTIFTCILPYGTFVPSG